MLACDNTVVGIAAGAVFPAVVVATRNLVAAGVAEAVVFAVAAVDSSVAVATGVGGAVATAFDTAALSDTRSCHTS